jgi:hypothetical protein
MDQTTRPPKAESGKSDPYANSEVAGQTILALVGGMEVVQARALRILAEFGIAPLKPDVWYPMSALLNSLRLIFEKIGPSTVRAIGRKIPDKAFFPSDMDSLEKGLRSIDVAYHMNHRGTDPIGGYYYEQTDRRSARMLCDNPYPCDLDLGLIESICDRFRPKDALWVRIEHDPKACRRRGDASCTYNIAW